jgi:hypothetical protein
MHTCKDWSCLGSTEANVIVITVATGISQSASTPDAQIRDARKHILADTAKALEKAERVNVPVPSSLTCARVNARVDARVDARVNARVEVRVNARV